MAKSAIFGCYFIHPRGKCLQCESKVLHQCRPKCSLKRCDSMITPFFLKTCVFVVVVEFPGQKVIVSPISLSYAALRLAHSCVKRLVAYISLPFLGPSLDWE